MSAIAQSSLLAVHPRVLKTLGASLALHAAVLGGWRLSSIVPPQLAAFEPIEVVLIGAPAPRVNPALRTAAEPVPPIKADEAQATPARDQSADDVGSGEPLVQARSDVAALNNPKPAYPLAARRRGVEGRVLLFARVSADGSCAEVKLKKSSGHVLLDDAALSAVRRWRFIPASRGRVPVDSWVDVPIAFRLES